MTYKLKKEKRKESLTVRDVADKLNLWGMDIDWKEKSLAEVLKYNGYEIIDKDWGEYEYSDIKGYLGVRIKKI